MFWSELPKGSFYIGNALFILMLCVYMYLKEKSSVIKFVLFSFALNNFLDETFFDNTTFGLNEILIGIAIVLFAIIKRNNDRKRTKHNTGTNDVLF